jgi:LPS export ABC transporter protein LptC
MVLQGKNRLGLVIVFILLQACVEEKKPLPFKAYKGPVMEVENLNVTFSDSGKTKITLSTAKQLKLEDGNEVYPKAMFLSFYDKKNVAYTTIRGDSGRFIKNENTYKIMGNVLVVNQLRNESLATPELTWFGNKLQIATDKKVTLKNPYETIHSMGMTANQDFTDVRLKKITGIIAVEGDSL